ncbi:DMT family transporter [Hydrogenophaga sp. 5NK40-0174]|uniref:DMT family transporter n=1 Tax=Hydrogenophaga sp. 5NK40-0174 TaxID=3127649 RepID=UPI00333FD58F
MASSTAPTSSNAHPQLASGLMFAAAGAIAFSGKAIIVKLAYRYDVDAVTLIMYRMLFALPLFIGLAWWASRHQRNAAGELAAPISWPDKLGIVGLGLTGYYLASFLDFLGLQYISASLERLILYLNPTLVLLLGWVVYRKRVTGMQLLAMAVSYAGVLLVFGHEVDFNGSNVWLGAALVFASAVSYAIYLVFSAEMLKRIGSMRLVGLASCVACVLCLVQFAMLRPLSAAMVAPEVIWLSILNAVACTFTPVILVMLGVERLGASLASQTGMLGPMSTIAMGVIILDETFNAWILAGTVLVLSGVFLVTRFGRPSR